uniref:Uncharacterized protein n=1 Tax=Amphimedon queenslandica TaxID=400682 RepID=A0A1X7UVC2_AMPQE
MNVRSTKEAIYKRKPDKRPYTPTSDDHYSRLEWLTSEFLPYLKEWEEYVKSCTDKTAREHKRMCIARETIEGLRITVTSFVELVEYIFSNIEGVKIFFSERLTQDPVEAFFGRQRMRGGYATNPTVHNHFYKAQCH